MSKASTKADAGAVDAARLVVMLNELRLPTIKTLWQSFAEQADREVSPAARFLIAIAEHGSAGRDRRRIERYLNKASLPLDKTLDSSDFNAVPTVSGARITDIAAGDA